MPYQLHCALLLLQACEELDDEILTTEERLDVGSELDDERNDDETILDERLVVTDDALPPQIAPVTTGVSIAPFPFTCNPNEIVCPG